MKVQKKISVKGDWVKAKEDVNNEDIIIIANDGEIVSGEYGDRHVFKVETKNGVKNLSFNQTTMNYLIDVFGEETNEWQGEKVKVWINRENVSGKMRNVIYLTAIDWIEGEEGFCSPNKEVKEEDIPVINEDESL